MGVVRLFSCFHRPAPCLRRYGPGMSYIHEIYAFQPLAQIFGRRTAMLTSLGTFALGSALCGSAQNMNWLIAARSEWSQLMHCTSDGVLTEMCFSRARRRRRWDPFYLEHHHLGPRATEGASGL